MTGGYALLARRLSRARPRRSDRLCSRATPGEWGLASRGVVLEREAAVVVDAIEHRGPVVETEPVPSFASKPLSHRATEPPIAPLLRHRLAVPGDLLGCNGVLRR
jgi:hypothetical protein